MDIGVLLLRVVVGSLFIGHGTQKLFGWFGGHGIEGSAGFLGSLGFPRPRFWAAVNGVVEAGAGLFLLLGFLTPLASAAIVGVMILAALTAHWPKGLWNQNGGYELPLVMATSASAVTFIGPGAYAVDTAIGWNLAGTTSGLLALAAGTLVASVVLAVRMLARPAAEQPEERRQHGRAA